MKIDLMHNRAEEEKDVCSAGQSRAEQGGTGWWGVHWEGGQEKREGCASRLVDAENWAKQNGRRATFILLSVKIV